MGSGEQVKPQLSQFIYNDTNRVQNISAYLFGSVLVEQQHANKCTEN